MRPAGCSRSLNFVAFCSPPSWCADDWFKGEVSLQMRAFNAICTAVKAHAAQALNPARPAHPTHLPVDTLDSVCSCHSQHWPHATFSMGTVLQGLGRCHRPWLHTLSTRQAQGTSMRRAWSLGLRCSSCSSRGPRYLRELREAHFRDHGQPSDAQIRVLGSRGDCTTYLSHL